MENLVNKSLRGRPKSEADVTNRCATERLKIALALSS